MSKIGLFYSFNTKNTSKVAEKMKELLGESIEVINVEEVTEEQFLSYKKMILGVPTWFDGELPNYWDEFMPAIEDMKLKGHEVAIFGLGDQKGYPQNFADAVGIIAEALEDRGAKIVAQTAVEGYDFEKSYAVRDNQFLGLILDEDTQAELTEPRLLAWIETLKKEFAIA